MLWKKPWRPEVMLMLGGGLVLAFFSGNLAGQLLRHAQVAGFRTDASAGAVLVATLCFHGAVLVGGYLFLKSHAISWREVLGLNNPHWPRHLLLAGGLLVMLLPVMLGLKFVSEIALQKMGWATEEQQAVALFANVKSVWLRIYLGIFAVVIAPVAEEFLFRGLLFSAAKKFGRPKLGWLGVSLLFALIHMNVSTFVPLFVLALALTWLYQKTEGLLAPMAAHSAFNAANLGLLVLAEKLKMLPS